MIEGSSGIFWLNMLSYKMETFPNVTKLDLKMDGKRLGAINQEVHMECSG
jgi:hypothetical protein